MNRLTNQTREIVARNIEPFQDTQHIDDAMFDISEGVIDFFQLIIKDQQIYIKFERGAGKYAWSCPSAPQKFLRKSLLMRKRNKRALEKLGFDL